MGCLAKCLVTQLVQNGFAKQRRQNWLFLLAQPGRYIHQTFRGRGGAGCQPESPPGLPTQRPNHMEVPVRF